jgi:hypothetical protein
VKRPAPAAVAAWATFAIFATVGTWLSFRAQIADDVKKAWEKETSLED